MAKTKKILAIHSKRRAIQRYGVNINKTARRFLIQQIQGNRAQFIKAHSRRVKEFVVTLEDKPLRILYDSTRSAIITFLPPEGSEEAKNYESACEVQ